MAVPEFNEIKAPALQLFADGKTRQVSEVFEALAGHFNLTEADLSEMLPSGRQRRWHNRATWACYDLYRAGLLDRPKKGRYVITEIGKQVAGKAPKFIDRNFLMQFPNFVQFVQSTNPPQQGTSLKAKKTELENEQEMTPEELIETAYRQLQENVKREVLDLVKKINPYRFEQLVVDLLLAMGYGGSREEAARVTKASNDEGIDGIINEDRLGLDVIYVQAKRWQSTVGRKEIQSFVGALAGQQAHKGVFITTSDFADSATNYARTITQKVILIDGSRLADLMIEHNIGVSRHHAYETKRIDSDYFEEE